MVYKNSKLQDWACDLEDSSCDQCDLARMVRTKVVISRGNYDAKIMIIGQNPGAEEDEKGEPFVGRTGKLLDRMFSAIGIDTNTQCYLTNACLCWTPNNENPAEYPGVIETCRQHLVVQVHYLRPEIIIAVGKPAFESICSTKSARWLASDVGKIRNLTFRWEDSDIGSYLRDIPVFPIMHPAYLLRNENAKPEAWEHMLKLSRIIGDLQIIPGYQPKED